MLLKLVYNSLDKWEFLITAKQKDYNYKSSEFIDIFIYGYPFNHKTEKWITPEFISENYKNNDWSFIENTEGVYSIVILDKKTGKCHIIVDRYGIYSLFYSITEKEIIISNKIIEILQDTKNAKLNKESIIEYLNFGYKIGNKTHFQNIFEFEAANTYIIDKELNMLEKSYWNIFDSNNKSIDYKNFTNVFNQHQNTALKLEEKIALPLTGGRDTRTILSACLQKKENLNCYTHGPRYHTDIMLAKKICNHFSLKHNKYLLNRKWIKTIDTRIEGNTDIFNGLNSFLDYLHVKKSLKKEEKNGELFLSGILGNQLFRNHPIGNRHSNSLDLDKNADFIFKNIPSMLFFKSDLSGIYKKLFKNYSCENFHTDIKNSIKKELAKAQNIEKPEDFAQYFLYKTYCSNVASNSLKFTGKYFKVFASFFHRDLLKQIKYIPLNERVSAQAQINIISKNNKYLSSLSYYNSGRIVKYIKLISNMITQKIFKINIFSDPNLVNYGNWLINHHKDFVIDILNYENIETKELFNKEEFEKFTSIFLKNKFQIKSKKHILFKFSLDKFMINFISLELWLKELKKNKIDFNF
ncbi:MAG: hypothetical protein JXR51_01340 [Bacteroidales bacterium]|nr:hypothetical protein [Bacteroidales bacterium]MBN2755788.1 hypothetical protein [Bacteroidales bacterium]